MISATDPVTHDSIRTCDEVDYVSGTTVTLDWSGANGHIIGQLGFEAAIPGGIYYLYSILFYG